MSSQVTTHMFNPFDGANFLTGTVLFSVLGIITGNPPVLAIVAAPFITGLFMVLCKVLEIAYKTRVDKRLAHWKARAERAEAEIAKRK